MKKEKKWKKRTTATATDAIAIYFFLTVFFIIYLFIFIWLFIFFENDVLGYDGSVVATQTVICDDFSNCAEYLFLQTHQNHGFFYLI
jgi:cation transport ATPase